MSYADLLAGDIRLGELRHLENAPEYTLNDSILQTLLRQFGLSVSRDRARTELRWLEEQGLVTINVISSVLVATLTSRGVDVAKGLAIVDGVKRPRPGA